MSDMNESIRQAQAALQQAEARDSQAALVAARLADDYEEYVSPEGISIASASFLEEDTIQCLQSFVTRLVRADVKPEEIARRHHRTFFRGRPQEKDIVAGWPVDRFEVRGAKYTHRMIVTPQRRLMGFAQDEPRTFTEFSFDDEVIVKSALTYLAKHAPVKKTYTKRYL